MKKTLFLFAAIFLIYCNAEPESESKPEPESETFTIEIIDGVRHVHNLAPKWGVKPKVELEFVRKIGDMESDNENYMLFRPPDISMDSEGNIFILDAGNYKIKKFDRNYKFIFSIGNKGQGPGELTGPSSVDILPDGNIVINDRASRRVNIFEKDGDFINSFRNEGKSPDRLIALNSGEIAVYYLMKQVPDGEGDAPMLVSVLDTKGNVLREFVQARKYDDPGTNFWCNSITMAGDASDNIYVNFEAQNRIEKYSSTGDILFRADRTLDYEETPEIIKEDVSDSQGTLVALKYNSFSRGIQVDGKGRIWSSTLKRQKIIDEKEEQVDPWNRIGKHENHMFEIFDNDGILLGRIQEEFFRGQNFRIFGDRLFLIDKVKEMAVFEYRIVEK